MCGFVILLLLLCRNSNGNCCCENSCMIPGEWARKTEVIDRNDDCECNRGCMACEEAADTCCDPVVEREDIWTSYRNTNKTIQK